MDDKKQMTDAELKKLLQDIDVPAPDEAAKISTLNVAESRFEEKVKKNAKTRQGNRAGFRPMDVLHDTFIFLTGGKNMKKAYFVTGGLVVGTLAVALLSNTALYDSFSPVSTQLAPADSSAELAVKEDARNRTKLAEKKAEVAPVAPPAAAPAMRQSLEGLAMGGATADMAVTSRAPTMEYMAPVPYIPHTPQAMPETFDHAQFERTDSNPVKLVQQEPVSTFSIDVDTASYSVVRRALDNGYLPPKHAVRIEELINYFDYDYPVPESRDEPFQPTVALYETPWNADTMLMHIGIKGHDLPADAPKPRSNLVFLIDTSGSMNSANRLPLLKQSFRMLLDTLHEDDTVAIVTYAGSAGIALEPTKAGDKRTILQAIDTLQASGSTAGADGIRTAYELAERNFDKDAVNRIMLATDGDFNVGITDRDQLKDYVERKRDSGIYLSILGFGMGNYNDAMMQALAQNGNGTAAYIDSLNEARKVLVDEAASILYPIANDVKIQVEFNPAAVSEYRLIGYETRQLRREDFNNDKVDAGDIGAGHTVTAIYELTPAGSKARLVDDLRYGDAHQAESEPKTDAGEYAFLKMRYKLPGESTSKLITRAITKDDVHTLDTLDDDIRFAGAVAAFGQLLRGDAYVGSFTYDDVLALATPARGEDAFNYRGEFLNLVRNAKVAQTR